MAGPISQSEDRIPWASTSPTTLSRAGNVKGDMPLSPPEGAVERHHDPLYTFPPDEHRVVEQSPQPISQQQEGASFVKVQPSSAPAKLRDHHYSLGHTAPNTGGTGPPCASIPLKPFTFELNTDAPFRAMRNTRDQSVHQGTHHTIPAPSDDREEVSNLARGAALLTVAEGPVKDSDAPQDASKEVWGRPFRVEWIRTERLPFFRTRHLRNPWNHGRQVKVSRDGTELEPSIGQQLLEEWDKPPPSPADVPEASSLTSSTRRRRDPKSIQHVP